MNPLLEQLHDIESIDTVDWWPPAIGWWVLMSIAFILILGLSFWLFHYLRYRRSWKHDALQKLAYLESHLSDVTARETLIALSQYLRRIALKRFARGECAGLIGEKWLHWLTEHDPKEYNWREKGNLLTHTPYAPETTSLSTEDIRELLQATRHWVY